MSPSSAVSAPGSASWTASPLAEAGGEAVWCALVHAERVGAREGVGWREGGDVAEGVAGGESVAEGGAEGGRRG
jgi:hypothetical protein